MDSIPTVSRAVSSTSETGEYNGPVVVNLGERLPLDNNESIINGITKSEIQNEPISELVTKQNAVHDLSSRIDSSNQEKWEDSGISPAIQKLRKDIQALTQVRRKKYSCDTGILKVHKSFPQLTKPHNQEGSSFSNLAFEGDAAALGANRIRAMSDVVHSLLREPIKEDIHPFGRGNIYTSLYDPDRPQKKQREDGKLFMWVLAILMILGLVGSVIVMSLMYRPIEYLNVNNTSSNVNVVSD